VVLPILQFLDLSQRHEGLTQAISDFYAEAARVCLDRHHTSPTVLAIHSPAHQDASAVWPAADDRTKNAWANEIDATEAGACGLALAAVEVSHGRVAIHRAETRTGADYYLADAEDDSDDLENAVRLEISGIDRGDEADVKQRLRAKVKQALEGNSNLPAMAAVVAFRARLVLIAEAVQT
jgi:hypothetical protein